MWGQCHYLMPISSIKYLPSRLWASNNKHARGIHFRQAWELIWKKNWNLGGPGHAPPPPPPPENSPPQNLCNMWLPCGHFYENIFIYFYSHCHQLVTRWKPPHFKTSNDWSPPQTPSDTCAQLSSYKIYLNPKLGPVMYEIKIKHWKIMAELHTGVFQTSFPHKLSLPAQLTFFLHKVASIILKSMSLFGVVQQFIKK